MEKITVLSGADSNDVALLTVDVSEERLNKHLIDSVLVKANDSMASQWATNHRVLQELLQHNTQHNTA